MTALTPSRNSAFALVITLIMLVLASILALSLLNTASTERTSATSVRDRYQAVLAVQNGFEAAKRALSTDGSGSPITKDDTFFVTRALPSPIPNPTPPANAEDTLAHYYFIGRSAANTATINYYPLFSGGTQQTLGPAVQPTGPNNTNTAVNLPSLLPDPSPSPTASPASLLPKVTTQWINVVDPQASPSPGPMLRYCYWIEDLGGYIDAKVTGNSSGPSSSHTRDTTVMQPLIDAGKAQPTWLIAAWTLFNPASNDPKGGPQQQYNQSITGQRGLLATSDIVRQAMANPSPSPNASPSPPLSDLSKAARHVIAGTKPDSEQLIVPYGVSAHATPGATPWYPNAGKSKVDINARIAAKDVTGIADAIKTNLPEWATTRRGGISSDDIYRKNIAANIVGYAPPGATPSTPINYTPLIDPASGDPSVMGSNYRGAGAFPLVSEFYDLVLYTKADWCDSSKTDHCAWFTRQIFVELWNMTDQTVTGTVNFKDNYFHPTNLGLYTYTFGTDPSQLPHGSTATCAGTCGQQTVTLGPNEYQVVSFGTWSYVLNDGPIFISDGPLTMSADSTSTYELYWNGVLVDYPHGKIVHSLKSIRDSGTTSQRYKWTGAIPGFTYSSGGSLIDSLGDPRSSFYNTASEAASSYDTSGSMWGRNRIYGATSANSYYEAMPSAWPDEGPLSPTPGPPYPHDSTVGPNQTITVLPFPKPANAPASQPQFAPVHVSTNNGSLKSITELANVFDPGQWFISPTRPSNSWFVWADITSSTAADSRYGGGMSLRIGRPEFTRFDQDGSRASQVLDTFSVGTRRETQGLVNLNTATRETLRALGSGLLLNRDSAIQPVSLQSSFDPPYSAAQADKFADAVIFTRDTKPFVSPSQLAQIKDASGRAFFGNVSEWDPNQTPPQTPPTQWNNAAATEYFSRIFDLASVRSRNFRVFVTGQYVDPRVLDSNGNPKVLAASKKVYQVFLNPNRDATTGAIGTPTIDVTYEHDL